MQQVTPVVTDTQRELVVVFDGRRGLPGTSVQGPQGEPGVSINMRGAWNGAEIYGPSDAVVADSTAVQGVTSLFVQRAGTATAPAPTAPRDDPLRWSEVGAYDLSNVTGAIWDVFQIGHGFTAVGTPVGYSESSNRWVTASNRLGDEVAVAVVREIRSPDEVVLQSSGEISNLDPGIIVPAGQTEFVPGRLYFVDRVRGYLNPTATVEATNFGSNALILATGPFEGVVLPWQQTPNVVGRRPVGFTGFFYTASPGQTVFSGADLDGNVLLYSVSEQNRVFVDGEFVSPRDGFTADDGLTVELAAPLAGGERVEIFVLAEPLSIIAPATSQPVDSISAMFDGVQSRFPLTVGGGASVVLSPAQNCLLWLDGSAQEPYQDFELTSGIEFGTESAIQFTAPPPPGTRFWALIGVAVSNLSFLSATVVVADDGTFNTLAATTLDVSGATTLASLGVSGASTLNTLSVTGASTLASLGVTGASTLASLGVSGASTLNTLSVTGASTLATLGVTGATTLNTLSVTGASTLNTLSVTGASTLATLGVTGATTLNTLSVTGASTLATLGVTGLAEAATLRAATLRGPTAGGQITIHDATIDEGTF